VPTTGDTRAVHPEDRLGPEEANRRGAVARAGWVCLGLVSVGLGGLGIVIPGLPTTVFFIVAAWAFARSSPRLEAWVLGLPRIGPMVLDHRAGLGMSRRAKAFAAGSIVFFVGLSVLIIDSVLVRAVVIAAGLVGVGVVAWHVPTREVVLARRAEP
jgi:uncharacterized membrane protein YbaN (DUF454 family)